ncbi:MAG: glycerol-3-phosphate 1-O-acyltransferase PlsY [Holosporales bacterium]|jgi:glycerol-3-phosphate acyltransferase PlsY|nr:glycerol-3-phosphate 1-O-acyltransferase PlsY [Holosporales bacterium]
MNLLLLCLTGYLIGSIPSGFLLAKFGAGIDLREFGSNSTGATNVLRAADKKLALITLLADAAKGIVFTLFLRLFSDNPYALVAAFCSIVGHVHPIWLRFRGGKGVATSAGIFLVLSPIFTLISVAIWAGIAKFIKISSVASSALVGSFTILTLYGYFTGQTQLDVVAFAVAVLIFALYTHFGNIRRILHKEETVVRAKTSRK